MNQRPSGYEPDELPDCSIPRYLIVICDYSSRSSLVPRLTSPRKILNLPRRQSIPRYLIVILRLLFEEQSGSQTYLSSEDTQSSSSAEYPAILNYGVEELTSTTTLCPVNLKNQAPILISNFCKVL